MNNDFEPVLNALMTKLQTVPGFQTYSRRLVIWTTEDLLQPAIFIRLGSIEDDLSSGSQFAITTIEVEVWIYAKADQPPAAAPDTSFNNLVKAVRNVLTAPDSPTGQNTLGGTVSWCRIDGKSETDAGDNDNQCKAVIPVKITLP